MTRLANRFLFAILTLVISASTWALDPEVQVLVDFETQANAVSTRSSESIEVRHFEIPYKRVEKDIAKSRLPKELLASLLFERNGETYIRWVINPEDTKWHKEVSAWLKKEGIPVVIDTYFKGYQTASRSYILEDPSSGYQFSCKTSTNKTGGNWKDKKQTWVDGWQIRMVTDYIVEQFEMNKAEHLVLLDEPAVFGLKDIDQGMVIRTLADLPKSKKYFLPGFSALHEVAGRYIAERNGSNDPVEFWNEHYNKPLARALAELFSKTGMIYDSPHSQNFLIELDADFRPTGRIALRDFGDMHLWKDFFAAKGRLDIVNRWEEGNIISGKDIWMTVGVLHGNTPPKWMTKNSYEKWISDFFLEYDKTLIKLAGLDLADTLGSISVSTGFSYSSKSYKATTPGWKKLLAPKRSLASYCKNLFKAQ